MPNTQQTLITITDTTANPNDPPVSEFTTDQDSPAIEARRAMITMLESAGTRPTSWQHNGPTLTMRAADGTTLVATITDHPDATAPEQILTWPQWRRRECAILRQENPDATGDDIARCIHRFRPEWVRYAVAAYEAGDDFTPAAIRNLPIDVIHRISGTHRYDNLRGHADPRTSPLRHYLDRLAAHNSQFRASS